MDLVGLYGAATSIFDHTSGVKLKRAHQRFCAPEASISTGKLKRRKWSGAEISAGMFSNVLIHSLAKKPRQKTRTPSVLIHTHRTNATHLPKDLDSIIHHMHTRVFNMIQGMLLAMGTILWRFLASPIRYRLKCGNCFDE
jgi:hypothetical protein